MNQFTISLLVKYLTYFTFINWTKKIIVYEYVSLRKFYKVLMFIYLRKNSCWPKDIDCKIFYLFEVYLFYVEKQHFTKNRCKQLPFLTSVYKLLKEKLFFKHNIVCSFNPNMNFEVFTSYIITIFFKLVLLINKLAKETLIISWYCNFIKIS